MALAWEELLALVVLLAGSCQVVLLVLGQVPRQVLARPVAAEAREARRHNCRTRQHLLHCSLCMRDIFDPAVLQSEVENT